jgi:hypothetical protein
MSVAAALFLVLGAAGVSAGVGMVIPVLEGRYHAYTNATVLEVTPARLLVRHDGGVSTVRLSELNPELQRQFGYDPAKAEELEVASPAPANVNPSPAARNSASNSGGRVKLPYGTFEKSFVVPGKGQLLLQIPAIWKVTTQPSPKGAPPSLTLRFEQQFSSDFVLMITTLSEAPANHTLDVRQMMEMTGNHALNGAVEKKLAYESFGGDQANGYYFSLTDKSWVKGKSSAGIYKYQTQGMATIANVTLVFAIMHNYFDSNDKKASLEMLQSARLIPDSPESPTWSQLDKLTKGGVDQESPPQR